MLSILFTTYAAVFGAELVGDKTFYTIGALTTQHKSWPIFCGSTLAFMIKMFAAVLLGGVIARLPVLIVGGLSATTFLTLGLVIWFKTPEANQQDIVQSNSSLKIALAAFAGIFFSEWCDIGQLTAAALSATYGAPPVVWCGAVLAMMTKGVLGITVGVAVRNRIPKNILRYGMVILCVAMGTFAMFESIHNSESGEARDRVMSQKQIK